MALSTADALELARSFEHAAWELRAYASAAVRHTDEDVPVERVYAAQQHRRIVSARLAARIAVNILDAAHPGTGDVADAGTRYPCGQPKPETATVDGMLLHYSTCAEARCRARWQTHCDGAAMYRRSLGSIGVSVEEDEEDGAA